MPLARIAAYASAGRRADGVGAGGGITQGAAKAGWAASDLDLMEMNEAFAAQAIAVNREMSWDSGLINVNGGAIARSHPLAGSGCRIVVTLLNEICVGGRLGVNICLER